MTASAERLTDRMKANDTDGFAAGLRDLQDVSDHWNQGAPSERLFKLEQLVSAAASTCGLAADANYVASVSRDVMLNGIRTCLEDIRTAVYAIPPT